MNTENNFSNLNQLKNSSKANKQNNSFNAMHESKTSGSSKYENVEPLPESARPRRDGPGGEDGQ